MSSLWEFHSVSQELIHYASADVNRAVESIVQLYQWSGRQMLVKPKRTNFISANQPWWDEECSHAKHLKYSAKCRFRVTGHKEDYCKYINLRKTFKSLCRCKKIAYQNDERNKTGFS